MNATPASPADYQVPPEIYDVGVGWDPQPETNRLLFLAGQAGIASPRGVLELGCATGRLLTPLVEVCPRVSGLELHGPFVEFARSHTAAEIQLGDMTDFDLGASFDLIFTSANTVRHVLTDDAVENFWRCVNRHLAPGGVFIADVELGRRHAEENAGKAVAWEISRGPYRVRVSWLPKQVPNSTTQLVPVEYKFDSLSHQPGRWTSAFALRMYEAPEFQDLACRIGGLTPCGLYENREPYLLESPAEKAEGRHLAVFKKT